jgi:hypothetical protein
MMPAVPRNTVFVLMPAVPRNTVFVLKPAVPRNTVFVLMPVVPTFDMLAVPAMFRFGGGDTKTMKYAQMLVLLRESSHLSLPGQDVRLRHLLLPYRH